MVVLLVKTNSKVTAEICPGWSVREPQSRPAALEPRSKLCETRANVLEGKLEVTPRAERERARQDSTTAKRLEQARNVRWLGPGDAQRLTA